MQTINAEIIRYIIEGKNITLTFTQMFSKLEYEFCFHNKDKVFEVLEIPIDDKIVGTPAWLTINKDSSVEGVRHIKKDNWVI